MTGAVRGFYSFSKTLCCAGLACFIFSLSAPAQLQNGQIKGVIVDPSGAVVAHAIVHIRNADTGYEADFESNDTGTYSAAELIVGSYSIRLEVNNTLAFMSFAVLSGLFFAAGKLLFLYSLVSSKASASDH